MDGTASDVRLSTSTDDWTRGPVIVTVSVYDEGTTGDALSAQLTGAVSDTLTLNRAGSTGGQYSGAFQANTNGDYTVTCADAVGNMGEGEIPIKNIDATASGITVSGNPDDWTKDDVAITLTVTDDQSGVSSVEVSKGGTPVIVSGSGGSYMFTASENGTYTVTATDQAGNSQSETVEINRIDKNKPTLTVTGG